jgi:hypothetical protein
MRSFEEWKSQYRHLDVRPRIPYHHGFDDFTGGFGMNAGSYASTTDYLEYFKGYKHAEREVSPWPPENPSEEEIEEVLRDAWHTARENLLVASTTEIFAFVRNYSDETEGLGDEQLMEFGKEIRDRARCPRCLSRQDIHGCPKRCDS